MAAEWIKASDELFDTTMYLLEEYHPQLYKTAQIGVIFRSEPAMVAGREVWSKAVKFPDIAKPFTGPAQNFDFLIWVAKGIWENQLDETQKQACIDRALCGCWLDENGNAKVLPPDFAAYRIELFRWGLWSPELKQAYEPMRQGVLDFMKEINDNRVEGSLIKLQPELVKGVA